MACDRKTRQIVTAASVVHITINPTSKHAQYSTTRHGIRIKHKQPRVALPEVTFALNHFKSSSFITMSTNTNPITEQARLPWVSEILRVIFQKHWLSMRVSRAMLH